MSRVPNTSTVVQLPALSRATQAPVSHGLPGHQLSCVQELQAIPRQLRLGLSHVSSALSGNTLGLGVHYPVDARVLRFAPQAATHPVAHQPPIVLVGVGHNWANGKQSSQRVVDTLLENFERFAFPSWNFASHLPGTRGIFSGACKLYYDTVWGGSSPRGNYILRSMMHTVAEECAQAQRPRTMIDLEAGLQLTRPDHWLNGAATLLLPFVVGTTISFISDWIGAPLLAGGTPGEASLPFIGAVLSLGLAHGSPLKKAIHPLGHTMLHCRSAQMAHNLRAQVESSDSIDQRPICAVVDLLNMIGILEWLERAQYREMILS